VFDPADLLTPGLTTSPAQYRGWRIHFFHLVGDAKDSVEQNILVPMSQSRDQIWVAPYGTVARYGQSRDTHTLTVNSVSDSVVTFTLVDSMRDDFFDHHLLVKVRVNNDWAAVEAEQNGVTIDVDLITHEGNTYALVEAVPDRGVVTLAKGGTSVLARSMRGAHTRSTAGVVRYDLCGRALGLRSAGCGVYVSSSGSGTLRRIAAP
jgi:hypothetical protein